MGGGDLNLKKSWHPSTLRNIERVWKAEQKHEVEKQKIEQLQKELAEERAREEIQAFAEEKGVVRKKEERLDWMYQGPAAMVNREDYLLGRKIDKTLELLQQQEAGIEPKKDENSDIACTMFSSQDLTGTATVDLANKIREDPLFSIMKKEKEQRKNLLTNPVKMKQLQQLLQASIAKKSKKHKKDKKNKHSDGDLVVEKVKDKKKKLKSSLKSDTASDGDSSSSKEVSRNSHSKDKRSHVNETYISSKKSSSGSQSRNQYSPNLKHKKSHSSYNYDSDDNDHYKSTSHLSSGNKKDYYNGDHRQNKRYKSSHNVNYEHEDSFQKSSSHRSSYNSENDSFDNRYKNYHSSSHIRDCGSQNGYHKKSDDCRRQTDKDKSSSKKKLDSAERERLLREMQDNAKWREEQRKRNVRKYKEEDEDKDDHKVDASDFLKPMLAKAAGKGSLENRVKQKIFSIQRSSADMEKHFAKR